MSSSRKVHVTYFVKDSDGHNSLNSIELTSDRSWTGSGYESMREFARRFSPPEGVRWMTVAQNNDSAVTFRVDDLESIEFEAVNDDE